MFEENEYELLLLLNYSELINEFRLNYNFVILFITWNPKNNLLEDTVVAADNVL